MPFYIVLFIVVAKIVYLKFESLYNFNVLNKSTSLNITQQELVALEIEGHTISSVGLTLLVAPIFYKIFKKFISKESLVLIFTLSLYFVSYKSFYRGLDEMMNIIIAKNTDKRHEAYYLNALKYGILNKSFGYEKFISKDFNSTDDIKNKVMLTNIFMLALIDNSLIDRIKKHGKEVIFELYAGKHVGYKDKREQLNKAAEKIKEAWVQYNEAQTKIRDEISHKNNQKEAYAIGEKYYKEFVVNINSKFDDYIKGEEKYEEEKNKELKKHLEKVDEYYKNLKQYFSWKGTKRAEEKYKEAMHKNFGRYIDPKEWCNGEDCPSKKAITYKIKKEIDSEAQARWNSKTGGLPFGLDHRGFLSHPIVRNGAILELQKKGLNVGSDFNYSKEQFMKAFFEKYKSEVDKKYNEAINKLRKEFRLEANIENIPLNLKWSEFVKLFEPQIIENIGSEQYGKQATQVIISKNLSKIDNLVFKPMFFNKINEKIFNKEDFMTNKEAAKYGDYAIKMLYIPPFAVGMSMLAGVLNFFTVFGSIITLLFFFAESKKAKIIAMGIKLTFIAGVIVFIYTNANKENYFENVPAIEDLRKSSYILNIYLHVIEPIIYLEYKNYNFVKSWLI